MKRNFLAAAIGKAMIEHQMKYVEQADKCPYYSERGRICNKCGQVHTDKPTAQEPKQ